MTGAGRQAAAWTVLTIGCENAEQGRTAEAFLRDKLAAEPVTLERAGSERVWVESYWEDALQAELAGRTATAAVPGCTYACRTAPQEDWTRFWRDRFHALDIGRLHIVPVWEEAPEAPFTFRVDPGLSFGTGLHFTTRFCLESLDALAREGSSGALLDLGAGSGILSMAACLLGFDPVRGVENDPLAVQAAGHNLELNGLSGRVTLVEGDARDILTESAPCEVICANLFSSLLIELLPGIVRRARRTVILSGIREQEAERVAAAAWAAGAEERVRDGDGEWCGMVWSTD